MSNSANPAVAILRADHIGDLVLTTPLIRALSKAGWNVDLIAPRGPLSLLEHDRRVRRLTPLEDICPNWPKGWLKLGKHLRRQCYDAVIVPYAHPRSLLLAAALSRARCRVAMWGGGPGRLLGLDCVRSGYFENPRPYAETILRSLHPLNISPDGIEPELFLTVDELSTAGSWLEGHLGSGTYIGIHPRGLGNSCNLPVAAYEELARTILQRTHWKIVFSGSTADGKAVPEIDQIVSEHPGRIWPVFGTLTLRELSAVVANLDALVVPSTGPLHIARAVKTPTITPFCPQLPICAQIWGHAPLALSAVEPAHPPCDATSLHKTNCDFRGSLTAADLFERLTQVVRHGSSTLRNTSTP